jgi:PPOX class probable F420-dependent enzyme
MIIGAAVTRRASDLERTYVVPHTEGGILQAVPAGHRDLLTARGTAVLTTIDHHSRPQSTAVWYLVDEDGLLKCSVTASRQKYKNLDRNPSCALFLIDPADTQRTLEIRAEAELIADPDNLDLARIALAYGVDPSMLMADDRHTVVLRPRRVVTNPPAR